MHIKVMPSMAALCVLNREEGIMFLRKIEAIGRTSHRSEDRAGPDTWERFLTSVVLKHGDWSITEHVAVTVVFYCDRGISHEIVRHRLGAYTQESTRFVNYDHDDTLQVISPFEPRTPEFLAWHRVVEEAAHTYSALVKSGTSPELARSVLPLSLGTKLVVTYNLRQWRHFLLMRTTRESHPQMRAMTIPLLHEFQRVIPLLYDDIEANGKQALNLTKGR